MKKIMILLSLVCFSACGVRGKPLPPENPPLLGRGEPNYSKATEKVDLPSQKKTKNSNTDQDDSEDQETP